VNMTYRVVGAYGAFASVLTLGGTPRRPRPATSVRFLPTIQSAVPIHVHPINVLQDCYIENRNNHTGLSFSNGA